MAEKLYQCAEQEHSEIFSGGLENSSQFELPQSRILVSIGDFRYLGLEGVCISGYHEGQYAWCVSLMEVSVYNFW